MQDNELVRQIIRSRGDAVQVDAEKTPAGWVGQIVLSRDDGSIEVLMTAPPLAKAKLAKQAAAQIIAGIRGT